MQRRRLLVGMALATALVVPLAGCGGKMRLNMAKDCQAHGGVWSASSETCDMTKGEAARAAKSAKSICEYQGGTYLPGGMCETPGEN
ncbi:MAG TPA: hypothetical protein VLV76_06515 [Candidatus Acidoferrum sp.]|jgi:hypothetical protein|nr:hypothetical protein [Candidatus Acidoferrum sp.]